MLKPIRNIMSLKKANGSEKEDLKMKNYLLNTSDIDASDHPNINPANGLPMLIGGAIDVEGNLYGSSDISGNTFGDDNFLTSDIFGEF